MDVPQLLAYASCSATGSEFRYFLRSSMPEQYPKVFDQAIPLGNLP